MRIAIVRKVDAVTGRPNEICGAFTTQKGFKSFLECLNLQSDYTSVKLTNGSLYNKYALITVKDLFDPESIYLFSVIRVTHEDGTESQFTVKIVEANRVW